MKLGSLIVGVALGVVVMGVGALLRAGPLNPPAGPVAPTYKTLTEVEPRIAIGPTTTPGSATAIAVISQPGSYYLTGNLQGVVGKNGIEIAASGVTIDLNGFEASGNGGLDGIATTVASLTNIAITNGSIRNWSGDGIDLQTTLAFNSQVTGIRADFNTGIGIKVGNAYLVERCGARSNGGGGISCGAQGAIRFCEAVSNTGTGITVGQGANVSHCLSGFNLFNPGDALRAGGYCTITDCTFTSSTAHGINTGPVSTIARCTVDGAALNGILAGNGSTVIGCSVNFSQNINIVVGNGSTVADCSVQFGNLGGIECGAQCVIRGNTCASNSNGSPNGFSIHAIGADNRIEANNCTQAGRGIDADSPGNIIIRNTCSGHTNNFDVVAGNVILVVNAATAPAVLGSSGGTAPGSTDPNANFSY